MKLLSNNKPGDFLADMVVDGVVDSGRLAQSLRISKAELADAVGLRVDALYRHEHEREKETQTRLRDVIEILDHVEPRGWCIQPTDNKAQVYGHTGAN